MRMLQAAGDDRAPLGLVEHGAGRIVELGRQVEAARGLAGAAQRGGGAGQRLLPVLAGLAFDGQDLDAGEIGHAGDADIGGIARQHHIAAGAAQRGHQQRQRLLAAGRHHHLRGIAVDALIQAQLLGDQGIDDAGRTAVLGEPPARQREVLAGRAGRVGLVVGHRLQPAFQQREELLGRAARGEGDRLRILVGGLVEEIHHREPRGSGACLSRQGPLSHPVHVPRRDGWPVGPARRWLRDISQCHIDGIEPPSFILCIACRFLAKAAHANWRLR